MSVIVWINCTERRVCCSRVNVQDSASSYMIDHILHIYLNCGQRDEDVIGHHSYKHMYNLSSCLYRTKE